jgi:hypothetical protein
MLHEKTFAIVGSHMNAQLLPKKYGADNINFGTVLFYCYSNHFDSVLQIIIFI